jgi:D-inositol-3-phosphate glycosyltransferase
MKNINIAWVALITLYWKLKRGLPNPMSSIHRIAMISVHTCPLATLGGKKTGGMNVYIYELAREFGRQGVHVDIFTRSQNPCLPHINQTIGENVRVVHLPAGPEGVLDPEQIFPFLPEFADAMDQFAQKEGLHYDIIYSHYWLSGLVALAMRQLWQVPVVHMFHTLGLMKNRIAEQPSGQPTDRPADQRSFSEAEIMAGADLLIAATPAERAQMLWLYRAPRHKIKIVPPGVNLERFRPMPASEAKTVLGISPESKMLLFVGRIEPLKGVSTILEALALLKKESSSVLANLSLSIIGGAPELTGENAEMDRLKALRESLNLQEVVIFLGAKGQDTLNLYYNAAEALIMPSDYESFGMVALEAMASGTPVIASNVGGLAFLVRDEQNGFHVPVRDPHVLAGKIQAILEDDGLAERLGDQAAQDAATYSWALVAQQLLDIFTHPVGAGKAELA